MGFQAMSSTQEKHNMHVGQHDVYDHHLYGLSSAAHEVRGGTVADVLHAAVREYTVLHPHGK